MPEYVRWTDHKQVGLGSTAAFSSLWNDEDFYGICGMKYSGET